MISVIKKAIKALTTFLVIISAGVSLSAPANAAANPDSTTWKLIQAFQGTINNPRDRNQIYWWTLLLFGILIIGFFTHLHYSQKRKQREIRIEGGSTGSSRRALMRLSVQQELFYAGLEEEAFSRTKTINMSGSGLLFATNRKFQQNDIIKVAMELEPGDLLRLRARVVRIAEKSGEDDNKQFMLGVQFISISKGEQDKIIGKIISLQQDVLFEEKRKKKRECIFCGAHIPADAGEDVIYCSKCSEYKFDDD